MNQQPRLLNNVGNESIENGIDINTNAYLLYKIKF